MVESAVAFFAVGTLAFWALLSVAAVLMFAALDKNSWFGALVILVAVGVVLGIWGEGITAAKWLFHHPTYVLGGVGIYLLAGAVWGVSRWWVEVRKLARECKEVYVNHRKAFLRRNEPDLGPGIAITDTTAIPAQLQNKWKEERIHHRHWRLETRGDGTLSPPQASEYKSEILTWMAFWPASLVWTILDDFVKELYENIYQQLATWLQSISDRAFADLIVTQQADRDKAAPGADDSDSASRPDRPWNVES